MKLPISAKRLGETLFSRFITRTYANECKRPPTSEAYAIWFLDHRNLSGILLAKPHATEQVVSFKELVIERSANMQYDQER